MKLGFDLDEVIVALCDLLVDYINKEFGLQWTAEDFVEYDLLKNNYVEHDEEYNSQIAKTVLKKVRDIDFQIKAKPYAEAPMFIRTLKKEGHSVHFITARDITAPEKTAKWLRKYKIPFDTIHHVGWGQEKGPIGRALNLDFYVDDHEFHLESMYKYKKRWRKGLALMTRPWNKDSIDASKFVRINDFKDLKRHLGIHKR
jgi:uncharacterized HAD superfamily protein